MTEEIQPLLSARQVADLLLVNVRRVRAIPARELPYVRLSAAGTRKYAERDVAEYLERRTIRG